ncbi:hypothetical protein AAVH_22742 [Aphelenchoides avenae]|nr:hypothetical protein AAVH_22742 [Aphelenchus avenae]
MKAHCLSSDHRDFMMEKCARTCGFCIVGETTSIAIAAGNGIRGVPVKTAPAIPACIDHHLNCTINEEWCANPLYAEYMIKFCAKTCFKCVTVPVTASGGGQPQPQIQIIMPQPSPPSGQNGPRGKVSSPQVPDDEDEEAQTPGKPKPSEQLKRPHSVTKRPAGGKKALTQPPQMSPRPVTEDEEEETSKRSSVALRQSPATARPTPTSSRRSTPLGSISKSTRAVPTSEPLDPSVASLVPSEDVKIKEPCKDNHDKCVVWVTKGFCSSTTYSLDEIRKMCGKSCKLC